MTTAYDVPPVLLIERLKEKLQAEGKIKPPEWAPFARTGVNTEKAPVQKDWWYRRVAAVLRKVYLHGPIGTSRLAAEFGGRRDDGSAPYHPRRGSRSIAREAMQQLEAMGLLTKTDKKGRSISAAGRKLLDSLAHENQMIALAQSGRVQRMIDDPTLRQILERVIPRKRDIKIERR